MAEVACQLSLADSAAVRPHYGYTAWLPTFIFAEIQPIRGHTCVPSVHYSRTQTREVDGRRNNTRMFGNSSTHSTPGYIATSCPLYTTHTCTLCTFAHYTRADRQSVFDTQCWRCDSITAVCCWHWRYFHKTFCYLQYIKYLARHCHLIILLHYL